MRIYQSCKRSNRLFNTETGCHITFDDLYGLLIGKLSCIKAKVIIIRILPDASGVIFVIFPAEFVIGVNLLLSRPPFNSLPFHFLFNAGLNGSINENLQHIGKVL